MFARSFRDTLVFLVLASALVSAEGSREHGVSGRRHHAVNIPTQSLNVTERDVHLQKRFDNTRFTLFAPGINACGSYDHENDAIVALNTHQWAGGSHCYDEITITYNGKTRQAKITDMCVECPYGAIDLSPGLFLSLVPGGYEQGVAYGSWWFGGDGGGGGGGSHEEDSDDEEEEKPKPTPKKETTTKNHTSTTHKEEPTTKSTKTTTTTKPATSTTEERPASPSTSTFSAPTATVTSFDKGNINSFNLALLQLVGLTEAQFAASDDA
ncbi:hypothetical protein C8Q74DRAFT_1362732 [Fomes fomentarius]|nr:hypothetical protein C8Q74DRAFT_1362732 [Fomes fomentarius]